MNEDNTNQTNPLTRRNAIKYGGTLAGTGLLAGCTGQSQEEPSSESTPTNESGDGSDESEESTDTEESTEEPTYTAELSPVGEVTLEEPPTDVFAHFPWFADMATALDRGESVNNVWWDGTASTLEYFTAGLDDIEIAWRDRTGAYGFEKEQLYELDSDLHLVDPAWVTTQDNWAREDIDEIAENVGPWLGNYYSSFHQSPPDEWADGYEYHRLWDVFEQIGNLYGERTRYEQLRAVHDDLLDTIEAGLPPEDERPIAAYLSISTDLSAIYVIRLNAPGYFNAHTRPLGAVDAFGGEEWDGAFKQVDMEAVLEADPDAILALWTVTDAVDFEQMHQNLADDPVGRELAAVRNDRVTVQGTRWQGPLMNLFQLEMTAKQLYPEQFGAWPTYENGDTYPEFSREEQLFDHQRVAEIITGDD
ncbi:ferrichrome-binding protein [Halorubrum sp. DM2]|uniref:ABC transporter substrate-binding protein n=1 Tax=Halorubrum sp. DM2 TaxID=2527867 RepID=UPI0024B7549C|nr:ABC transporter substrate-binding protein [Halorubrum sp. DM2]VTT86259.1 ferrichrome-binding protein [Halorubrum sp. DM2]